ncbi:vicilin-like seed storage protein At2g18540 [Harpegnathos saltator]|uniref:vicilin-like seed storage protein At2g18540 n=1 Tax=Harpegnathos saltator TaxID=610380 RepID=UPI000DBED38D|nr:vicilin-like seed storage protein At2g18540 [Harpegnathos saltator]
MFVDILGRIQQWSGIVQNKISSCKNEINNLSKELLAQACEMADLKAQIADYQSKETSRTGKRQTDDQSKENEKDKKYDDDIEELKTKIEEDEEIDQKKAAKEKNGERPKKETERERDRRETEEMQKRRTEEDQERRRTEEDQERGRTEEDQERRRTEEDQERRRTEEDQERRRTEEDERDREDREDEQRETDRKRFTKDPQRKTKENAFRTVLVQSTEQEKERIKYESKLEAEVTRLRKENERIMKERVEYENAIQRALLRGVSSLNVEALRVLRCPPIPCCSPCAPCPAITVVSPEPVVPCPRSAKRHPKSTAATICSNKASPNNRSKKNENREAYDTTRRPCSTPCCPVVSANSRKLTDSNMFLLLRQGDARNLRGPDESVTTVCKSPAMTNADIAPLPRFGV